MSEAAKFVGRSATVGVIDRQSPTKPGPEHGITEMKNRHRSGFAHGALALAVTLMLLLAGWAAAGSAYAGRWMEVSCVNPNRSAAPSEGWSSFGSGGGYGSDNGTGCGPGSSMYAILSSQAAVGVGADETLQYTPPAGSRLTGGSLDVSLYADGYGYSASGTAALYTPEFAYNGSNVFFQCAAALTACSASGSDFSGTLEIPSSRGGNLYVSAGCGGTAGYSCNAGGSEGAWSLVRLWWADLLLENAATPSASNIGGTLLDPNAQGTAELTMSAADPGGPGVYLVVVQIDGSTVYSGTPNGNGGRCVPVGTSGGTLMFDYSQPCPASESVDVPVNTTSLPDGQHTLKVIVDDAAGNSAVVYDATISTKQPAASSLGAQPGPGTGSSASGGNSPVGDARGTPNSTGANTAAQITLGMKRRVSRRYARRALRLPGRLLNAQGQPIAGARLDVLQQVKGSPKLRLIGHADTRADGTFVAKVPDGPSRMVEVAYRAFSSERRYATSAKITELVGAGVRLEVAPRSARSDGTITLAGRVLGPIPPRGVVVELLVHYRGRWEPFRTPRTNAQGRFKVAYQFQGGVGRFPFRAMVFNGQGGFPFSRGASEVVDVTTS